MLRWQLGQTTEKLKTVASGEGDGISKSCFHYK